MINKLLKELSSAELITLLDGERPVLVDFYATWCSPCKAMEPVLERLAERYAPKVEIAKVNIDKSSDLSGQYGVRGVPSFLLFVNGKPVERAIGIMSENALAALVEPYLNEDENEDYRISA